MLDINKLGWRGAGLFGLLLMLVAGSVSAFEKVASVEGITEYRMENGLRVLLVPDESRPTTTVNITYMVGSRHEGYGESGMAHLLEHLLFMSTEKYDDITEEISRRGGRANGTTWYDRTNYFQTFPATEENIEWSLSMEAERMVNALLKEEDLESEMTVVRNEFEGGENSPFRILMQRTMAVANEWHGYGRSTIGARSDIENVPMGRLRAFYRKYYQPDNAVLAISGRFDEEHVLSVVEREFGAIARPERTGEMTLWPTYTRNPTQDGEREVTLRRTGDEQLVMAHFHGPAAAHEDFAAIQVVSHVLGNEPSGRLYQALVEEGKASSTGAFSPSLREPGFLLAFAQLRSSHSLDEAREIMLNVFDQLHEEPITQEELDRARNSLLRTIEMTLRSSDRIGVALTETAAAGDWRLIFLQRDRLQALELDDVNRVAKHYFKPSNRTLGLFVPTESPDRSEIPEAPPVESLVADYVGTTEREAGERFDPTFENIEERLAQFELDSGLKVALLPKSTRGNSINGNLTLRFGNEEFLTGQSHLTSVVASMLMRGTEQRSRQEIRDALDGMQSTLGVNGGRAQVSARMETTREHLDDFLDLLFEVLTQPEFSESELETLRQRALANIESQQSDPGAVANNEISRLVSPHKDPDHPMYEPTFEERIQRWEAITIEDVRQHYEQLFGVSDASTLVLVGDFDADEVQARFQAALADWQSAQPFERIATPAYEVEPQRIRKQLDDKANAMLLGMSVIPMRDDHPDYPAMTFGNYLLGGGFLNSRLARRIRQAEGISYGVGSFMSAHPIDQRTTFGVYAMFAPENIERLFAALEEEITRAVDEEFTEDEMRNGLEGWLQAQEVTRGNDPQLVGILASNLYFGRDMSHQQRLEEQVAALTAEDIKAAFARHISYDGLAFVVAGDFDDESDED